MRVPKVDRVRASRRFGAFAVLTLGAPSGRSGPLTGTETAAHFEQVARAHRLGETGHYDLRLVDMLISRVRTARKEERRTWEEGD
jgi:hypothetical protein